jgi:hypothetical protein
MFIQIFEEKINVFPLILHNLFSEFQWADFVVSRYVTYYFIILAEMFNELKSEPDWNKP